MPAKDRHHEIVKRALVKDGWAIVQDQVYLSDGKRHVWVDLSVRRADAATLVLIEIKGFENVASGVDALTSAVGQYAYYKAMLQYLHMDNDLYLAIPTAAYTGIFQSPAVRQVVENIGLALLVFNPDTEEVVQWIR